MVKKKNTALKVILSIVLSLAVIGTGIYFYFFHGLIPGCILENVSVLGIDIGGKTPEEAVIVLNSALEEIYSRSILIP